VMADAEAEEDALGLGAGAPDPQATRPIDANQRIIQTDRMPRSLKRRVLNRIGRRSGTGSIALASKEIWMRA